MRATVATTLTIILGSIAPEKHADSVVLSTDIVEASVENVPKAEILFTVIDDTLWV